MKRFAQYMAVFVAMVVATACTMIDENELYEGITPSGSGDVVTIVPRMSHFTDCNVATRSPKEGDEGKVTSMAMALFPIEENGEIKEIKPSVFYQYNADGNMLFVLDRNKAPFVDSEGNPLYQNKQFVMYIIANMQGTGIPEQNPDYSSDESQEDYGIGWTPQRFVEKCHTIQGGSCFEQIGEKGLPMIGMLGDQFSGYGDGKKFIFMPTKGTANNDKGLPTVDDTPTDNLEIPMRTLYAKVSFTIEVDSDQEIVGHAAPRFDLSGYQVNNAASSVYLSRSLNVDDDVPDYDVPDYEAVVSSEFHNVETQGLYAQGATKATFHCYVPERYLDPTTWPKDYTYDFGENGGEITGYSNIPDEMKKYAQRFKPELVSEDQNATYVSIKGKFTDHQKHVYDVTYRIYLGKDNYGDFNIVRNTHYNNFLTIRGIDNADDQSASYDPDRVDNPSAPISIDHRVSIERSTPLVVGLRRETLLDSHIEVRPLRLHLSGGDPENNPKEATITLLKAKDSDPDPSEWIAMESSTAANATNHITEVGTTSYGKRKYFTTNLIETINGGISRDSEGNISFSVDGLNDKSNQTIWIYVDENTTTESRSAIVRINYADVDTDYYLVQHGLFEVVGASGHTYYIEKYEEYLYNYDVDDSYGQTKEEGMQWGLDGVQLSKKYQSFRCDETNTQWTNYINSGDAPTFDFYIGKHDSFAGETGGTVRNYAGWDFTKEIYENSNGGVKVRTMAEQPEGAVEYCYNRNKRKDDGSGSIESINWYLPSVDELEDFIVAAYGSFKEFQDNYYWASQPAYIRNVFYYEYNETTEIFGAVISKRRRDTYPFVVYDDNPNYARATKVVVGSDGEFDYALSGLNEVPDPDHYVDYTSGTEMINFGYYNKMYLWKRERSGTVSPTETFGNPDYNGGEEFYEYRDGNPIYKDGTNIHKRYHIHLGHLEHMKQEGYHERTRSNRVRCIRKVE